MPEKNKQARGTDILSNTEGQEPKETKQAKSTHLWRTDGWISQNTSQARDTHSLSNTEGRLNQNT
jgi:hypothetical protein